MSKKSTIANGGLKNKMQASSPELSVLLTDIAEASSFISPIWPLETFIAVNHISGLEKFDFHQALKKMTHLLGGRGYLSNDNYKRLLSTGRITDHDLDLGKQENEIRTRLNLQKLLSLGASTQTNKHKPVLNATDRCLTVSDWLSKKQETDFLQKINKEVLKWCCAYFDRGHATWKMPHRELGLYRSWKKLVAYESSLPIFGYKFSSKASVLPDDSLSAIVELLSQLGVAEDQRVSYLVRHLSQMPGWTSYIRWVEKNTQDPKDKHVISDYLALRLFYELAICRSILDKEFGANANLKTIEKYFSPQTESASTSNTSISDREVLTEDLSLYQEAYEINYRNQLITQLKANLENKLKDNIADLAPSAQIVFCIDVRSEGMRRALESVANYQTIGFAGFFGFPVSYTPVNSQTRASLCPVLLTPKYDVSYRPNSLKNKSIFAWLSASFANNVLSIIMHFLRSNLLSKFYFVEAAGIWAVPLAFARNFFPGFFTKINKTLLHAEAPETPFSLELSPEDSLGLPLSDQLYFAEASLKAMGLNDHFAPLVVFTGHGSSSVNNPYVSSLDCGACGGNSGALSAQLAARILNQPVIKENLQERGINIPATTTFIAAEHNTTTDEIRIFDPGKLSPQQRELLSEMQANFKLAAEKLHHERILQFELDDRQSMNARAVDWSQTRPEWGLARNAAFIAARRTVTRGLNLERRVFLHDYNKNNDSHNAILELILTAPLVVAQWINMQYYLSSVDPTTFGSGSKTIHNVVGNLGVMQGSVSDLKLGLPWESVALNSEQLFHEPMRLLAIIEANRENIDNIVDRNPQLKDIVRNRWIRLIALEENTFFESIGPGHWLALQSNHSQQPELSQLAS